MQNRIPKCRFAIAAISDGYDQPFTQYFAESCGTNWHLYIFDQSLVTGKEEIQRIQPELLPLITGRNERHFGKMVFRSVITLSRQSLWKIISLVRRIEQVGITIKYVEIDLHHRFYCIQNCLHMVHIPVFQNILMVQFCLGIANKQA